MVRSDVLNEKEVYMHAISLRKEQMSLFVQPLLYRLTAAL